MVGGAPLQGVGMGVRRSSPVAVADAADGAGEVGVGQVAQGADRVRQRGAGREGGGHVARHPPGEGEQRLREAGPGRRPTPGAGVRSAAAGPAPVRTGRRRTRRAGPLRRARRSAAGRRQPALRGPRADPREPRLMGPHRPQPAVAAAPSTPYLDGGPTIPGLAEALLARDEARECVNTNKRQVASLEAALQLPRPSASRSTARTKRAGVADAAGRGRRGESRCGYRASGAHRHAASRAAGCRGGRGGRRAQGQRRKAQGTRTPRAAAARGVGRREDARKGGVRRSARRMQSAGEALQRCAEAHRRDPRRHPRRHRRVPRRADGGSAAGMPSTAGPLRPPLRAPGRSEARTSRTSCRSAPSRSRRSTPPAMLGFACAWRRGGSSQAGAGKRLPSRQGNVLERSRYQGVLNRRPVSTEPGRHAR